MVSPKRLLRKLLRYKAPALIFKDGRIGLDERMPALSPVLVERGKDDSVLIIGFCGAKRAGPAWYEFFDTTKALGYSRILLVDNYGLHFHHGIDTERPDFLSLIAYLRREIAQLRPDKVVCIGSSAGGYAAIAAGHLLGADYVHAFSPQTLLRMGLPVFPYHSGRSFLTSLRLYPRHMLSRLRLFLSKRARRDLFDLAEILKKPNGRTTYFVHYCCGLQQDRNHAGHIRGITGVVSIGYPCSTHSVAICLAKKGFLTKALAIGNQNRLVEMAKGYFPEGLELSVTRPEMMRDSAA